MSKILPFCIAITGLVNFIPIIGMTSKEMLQSLYQIPVASAELELLLRHRAVLFGCLGGLMLYSLLKPSLRPAAACLGLISMLYFSGLAWQLDIQNDKLLQIAFIDLIVSFILVAGMAIEFYRLFLSHHSETTLNQGVKK